MPVFVFCRKFCHNCQLSVPQSGKWNMSASIGGLVDVGVGVGVVVAV